MPNKTISDACGSRNTLTCDRSITHPNIAKITQASWSSYVTMNRCNHQLHHRPLLMAVTKLTLTTPFASALSHSLPTKVLFGGVRVYWKFAGDLLESQIPALKLGRREINDNMCKGPFLVNEQDFEKNR